MIYERELDGALFRYDGDTGNIWRWFKGATRERDLKRYPPQWKMCAVSIGDAGYHMVPLNRRKYMAHRVIWFVVHGEWPAGQIDHEDHCRSNNRLVNLRDVSQSENLKNKTLHKNNTSGVIGVSWHSQSRTWSACIRHEKIYYGLGYFSEKSLAIEARKQAETQFHFHPNHGLQANV